MSLCHVFDLANGPYCACKGLRKLGVEVDLIIQRPAHVASLPQMEDGEFDPVELGNPYDPNWSAFKWEKPDWVHVWDTRKRGYPFSRTLKWFTLIAMLRKYDLIVGNAPFAKIGVAYSRLFRKPYVIFDAGWIRYLPENRPSYAEARQGYRKAALIMFTNVDTEVMFEEQGYDTSKLAYSPFAVDTAKYAPSDEAPDHVVFFHPARQNWAEKGNVNVLEAFAQYVKHDSAAELVMSDWGQDLEKSRDLIRRLRIEGKIRWVQLCSKNQLVHLYNSSTAVLDQFVFGATGVLVMEVMSCAVPAITYIKPELWQRYHSTSPPVASAQTSDEIYEWMLKFATDPKTRYEFGRREREWILRNCDDRVVAEQQLATFREHDLI